MPSTAEPDRNRPRRVADVQLRGPAQPLRARVHWPTPTEASGAPALFVLFNGSGSPLDSDDGPDSQVHALCALLGVVVLSASLATVPEAVATMEWAADHAAELSADPEWLIVAGAGSGADLAARVALFARDSGWPSIARQVLIQPKGDVAVSRAALLTGVAPATVVTVGHREPCAVALRHAGVDVEEVHGNDLPAALDCLARTVRRKLDAPRRRPS